MPSPRGMTGANPALNMLSEALRCGSTQVGTRWRRLAPGGQALLVVAHLRKGETYGDLVPGSVWARRLCSVTSAKRCRCWPQWRRSWEAIETALRKAFVVLDGTLLRIDRVGMASGRDRPEHFNATA